MRSRQRRKARTAGGSCFERIWSSAATGEESVTESFCSEAYSSFYHLLTGQKPFEGQQWALAKKIIQDDPVWPSKLVQIPPDIDRVVARAMAKAPEQRYQRAKGFADALRRILEGKAPEAPGESPFPLSGQPQGPAPGGEADKEFWEGVEDSDDPDDIALYLEQFPRGAFAEQAKQKIADLKAKKK